jgi:hypothetical protein
VAEKNSLLYDKNYIIVPLKERREIGRKDRIQMATVAVASVLV